MSTQPNKPANWPSKNPKMPSDPARDNSPPKPASPSRPKTTSK